MCVRVCVSVWKGGWNEGSGELHVLTKPKHHPVLCKGNVVWRNGPKWPLAASSFVITGNCMTEVVCDLYSYSIYASIHHQPAPTIT